MRQMKEFEKQKCKKIPNRYAKIALEQHLSLDETMSQRIMLRAQLTQKKMEEGMKNYSQKRLAIGFKSVREAHKDNPELLKQDSSRKSMVRETANSRVTPLGLEIPKN